MWRFPGKSYEIRDPVHGFIKINEWERDIINHPVFQRLRRIRQLGLTEMVYPGAIHTRFEHSLGVMHVASRMFEEIVRKRRDFLESELNFTQAGLERDFVLVRLAALLHDVGHPPFSHATEELMPRNPKGKPYKHEHYSSAVVKYLLRDVIENHPFNQNYDIKAENIADFLEGKSSAGRSLFWRTLITGQLDADRADYLLRDSLHIGVAYGQYDLERLLVTLSVALDPEEKEPILVVEEGGFHAAEALILARYMMFTQVYFHHTRRAYDHHAVQAIKVLLEKFWRGVFPSPTLEEIQHYVEWDDWRVTGYIQAGEAGEHGEIILNRKHHRAVYSTSETPDEAELEKIEVLTEKLGDMVAFVDKAEKSWYKFEAEDIYILTHQRGNDPQKLSALSSVIRGLEPVSQIRIYVPLEQKEKALEIINNLS